MTALRVVLCSALLPLVAACVMPDELSKLQKDMVDVRQQLRSVADGQAEMERRLGEISAAREENPQAVAQEDLAAIGLRMDQFDRQMSVVTERMNDVDQRLDRYSQDVQQNREMMRRGGGAASPSPLPTTPSAEPGQTPTPAPGSEAFPDPEALYNTAYADFSKGNFLLAISGFQEYQGRFPDSALADNALYWIAECHFSQGDFSSAVESLDQLLNVYPKSDKAAAGNLKKALAFIEQNQVGQAIVQLRYVVSAYPGTDEARLARDKLSGLGAAPR